MRTFILTIIMALIICTPAQAFDNEAPANDGVLFAAVEVADDYWAARSELVASLGGRINMEAAEIIMYDEPRRGEAAARGDFGFDRIWVDRRWFRDIRIAMKFGRSSGVFALTDLAELMIHERGHNAGLWFGDNQDHYHSSDSRDVMNATEWVSPIEARQFARQISKRYGYFKTPKRKLRPDPAPTR